MALSSGEPNPCGRPMASSLDGVVPKSWPALAGLVLGALLLALATLCSPRVPGEAETEATADASWCAVLEYAHQHGLQFGTQIAFTYGPLGFLAVPYAWSTPPALRLFTDLLLGFACALGICLNARRLGLIWGIFLLGSYAFLLANIYPRADLFLELNLLTWGILCISTSRRTRVLFGLILAGVAIFACLVKVTLLVMAILTMSVVIANYWLRGDRRLGLGLATLVLLGFVLAWLAAGQTLSNLHVFLHRAFITSLGYNSAMGYEGSILLRGRAMLIAFLTAATVVTASAGLLVREPGIPRIRRLLLSGWFITMLFLVWKHGFVRTDLYHAGFFFGFAPLLALLAGAAPLDPLAPVPSGTDKPNRFRFYWARLSLRPGFWPKLLAVSCGLVCLVSVQTIVLPGNWEASLRQPLVALATSVSHLARPRAYAEQLGRALNAERERYQLPALRAQIGKATLDMFGCEQISVFANDLNYRPRPVFQTYAAYSAPLMEWNERFYQSALAPDYVLFRLLGMDRKFPPLEDAFLLRHLLMNYRLVAREQQYLLLQSSGKATPRLTLLKEGIAHPGEPVSLAEYGGANLWLELDLQESLLGRLRHFFYQPAKSRLVVWPGINTGRNVRRFRAPAAMAKAGFLISPLELNNDDVLALYNGAEPVRPSAWAIEFNPGDRKFWQPTFSFRVYRLDNPLGHPASAP